MQRRDQNETPPPPDDSGSWARPGLGVIPEPGAEQRLESVTQLVIRADIQRSRALARIDRSRHFRLRGCASITEYGGRIGLRACVTRDLVRTGYMLIKVPELEGLLINAKLSFRAVGKLYEVLSEPGAAIQPWLKEAIKRSTRDFCALVDEHIAAGRLRSQPVRISMVTSEQGVRYFRRACTLAQRRIGRVLSDGEAFEEISYDYVKRNDPLDPGGPPPPGIVRGPGDDDGDDEDDDEGPDDFGPDDVHPPDGGDGGGPRPPKARTGSGDDDDGEDGEDGDGAADDASDPDATSQAASDPGSPPRSRYISKAVKKAVRLRHRDRCAVPCCTARAWIEFAHLKPHRDGGDRSERNLILLCWMHNQMMEVGFLEVEGPPDDLRFFDSRGVEYTEDGDFR